MKNLHLFYCVESHLTRPKDHYGLKKVKRDDWEPSIHTRIFSDQFWTGQRIELKEGTAPTRFKMFPKYFKKARNEIYI